PGAFGAFTGSFGAAAVPHLALWHGFSPAFLLSLGVFAAAGLAFWMSERWGWTRFALPRGLQFDRGFDWLIEGVPHAGKRLNRALGFTRPSSFLPIVAAVAIFAVLAFVVRSRASLLAVLSLLEAPALDDEGALRWGVVILISTGTLL